MWGLKRSDWAFCEEQQHGMMKRHEWMSVKERMKHISCRNELTGREQTRGWKKSSKMSEYFLKNRVKVDVLSGSGWGFFSILFSGNILLNAFEIQWHIVFLNDLLKKEGKAGAKLWCCAQKIVLDLFYVCNKLPTFAAASYQDSRYPQFQERQFIETKKWGKRISVDKKFKKKRT